MKQNLTVLRRVSFRSQVGWFLVMTVTELPHVLTKGRDAASVAYARCLVGMNHHCVFTCILWTDSSCTGRIWLLVLLRRVMNVFSSYKVTVLF